MRNGPIVRRWRRVPELLAAGMVLAVTLTASGTMAGAAGDEPVGSTEPTTTPAMPTTTAMSAGSSTSAGTRMAPSTTAAVAAGTDPDASSTGWVEVFADTPASGSALGVRGGVFAPASTVEIWFPDREMRLATTTADLDGEIAEQVVLPIVVPGDYEIRLLGTDPAGAPVDVSTEVAIAEESVVRVPVTGTEITSEAAPILIVALILGGLLIARRTSHKVRRSESE